MNMLAAIASSTLGCRRLVACVHVSQRPALAQQGKTAMLGLLLHSKERLRPLGL